MPAAQSTPDSSSRRHTHHRNRRSRRLIACVASILAGGLALTGCTSNSNDDTADVDLVTLHPSGPKDAWFSDVYGEGISGVYATSDTLCAVISGGPLGSAAATDGVTADLAIVSVVDPGRGNHVEARLMLNGTLVWQRPDLRCSEGAFLDGALIVTPSSFAEPPVSELLDPSNGSTLLSIATEQVPSYATQLGRADELRVIDTGDTIFGVQTDGSITWKFTNDFANSFVPLADGNFALIGPNERLAVLDGHSGTIRTDLSGLKSSDVTWASDGYIVRINQSDPEYAFYDLDGNEIERTTGESQYTFVPQSYRGVTFTIEDHLQAGTAVGVNQAGELALWDTPNRKTLTPAGGIDLPDSVIALRGLSISGDYLLFNNRDGDGISLIDRDANVVFDVAIPYQELRIEGGHIILKSRASSIVLLPGR